MRQALPTSAVGAFATLGSQAQAQAPGEAKGSFAVNGKSYALSHAAAFADTGDARRPTVLVLSDKPLPVQALVSSASLSLERNMNGFSGIALWVDGKREIFRAEYDEKGDQTATSGLFELAFSVPAGPALAGTVRSTAAAAKLKAPVTADLSFQAQPR